VKKFSLDSFSSTSLLSIREQGGQKRFMNLHQSSDIWILGKAIDTIPPGKANERKPDLWPELVCFFLFSVSFRCATLCKPLMVGDFVYRFLL